MTTSALTPTADPAGPRRRTPLLVAPPGRGDTRRPGGRGPAAPGTRGPGRTPGGARTVAAAPPAAPHQWFADRLLEVLSGRRPAGWMLRHTAGEQTYDRLWRLAAQGVLRPPAGRPCPVVRDCGHRVPAPGVVEAFARIASGDAVRALAFRLERGADRRWRCTAVDFAGPSW